ncbi:MAG TPA: SMP-30/gluconolactonase/LRE family protein [Nitriliruptoraceae bacterium]|nr:SMP-30/gluconolactonase/LRE family protein [Nitriliruptoraceae bacterium]
MVSDFEPVRWNPPPAPGLVGDMAVNTRLRDATRWLVGEAGPEDVAVIPDGAHAGVYCGTAPGGIWRFGLDGSGPTRVATVAGRPLGIEVIDAETLLVCAADRGLVRLGLVSGGQELIVEEVEGQRLTFTNNATIHADGRIFFTDSSARHPIDRFDDDLVEHAGTGRLCVRYPDGGTEVVLHGLQFANGVTLHPDNGDVLVAETGSYCIQRVAVDGSDAGAVSVFARNLPGFPDNMSTGPLGVVWVALASPRRASVDRMAPLPGFVKQVVVRLPQRLKPSAGRHGIILGLDGAGEVVANLQDPGGEVIHTTTGVREHDGRLYVGSLVEPAIAVLDLHESDFATP